MVGVIGRILGDARSNIGGMQVARDRRGGLALVALTVDSAIPADVLDDIAGEMRAQVVRAVDMSR
jgi:D-3-phosphoglycerate dehydrogenase / 2-oxoglutarate reductase